MTSIDIHEILTLFNWINLRLIQERIIYQNKNACKRDSVRWGGEGGSLDPCIFPTSLIR